jgi:hypothetical protein
MNKVFYAQFPGNIVPLAMVLPPGFGLALPQLPPIPWTDNHASLANKYFGALIGSNPTLHTQPASIGSTVRGHSADPAATASPAALPPTFAFPD